MSAADHLNSDQIRDLTERVNHPDVAGFTVRAHGARAGEVPQGARDSYIHAIPKYGLNNIPHPAREEDLMGFTETRSGPLHEPGNYFGGWYNQGGKTPDTPSGTVALDVVKALPRNPQNLRRAAFNAALGGEEEIGELGKKGEYVGGHDVDTVMAKSVWG